VRVVALKSSLRIRLLLILICALGQIRRSRADAQLLSLLDAAPLQQTGPMDVLSAPQGHERLTALLDLADHVAVADVACLGRADFMSTPDSTFVPRFQIVVFSSLETVKGTPVPLIPVRFTLLNSPFLSSSMMLDPQLFYPRAKFILMLRQKVAPPPRTRLPPITSDAQFWQNELIAGWVPDPLNPRHEVQYEPIGVSVGIFRFTDGALDAIEQVLSQP